MARLSNGHADDDTKHDTESDTTDSSSDDEDDDDDDDDDDESSTDTDEDTPGQLPGISVKQAARAAVLAAGATGLAGLDRPDGNPTPRHRRIDSLRAASKMGDMNVDGEPSQESSGGESDDDAPAQLQAAARRAESRRTARGRSSSPRRAVRGNKASAVRAASKVKPWGSTSPASARSRRQRKLINTGKALGKFQTGKKNHPKELTPRVRETPPPVKVRKSKRRRGPAKTIWEAAKNGDTSAVRTFVVEQDVYVNSKDKLGNTPLIWAAYGGHRHTLQELVALGADVNMKTRVREAMLRVMSPHSTPVFLFGTSQSGFTALMLACHRGFEDIVEELIFSCAKVNSKDKEGTTALMRAAKNGFKPIVNMLISNGAPVRAKNKVRWPLHQTRVDQ